MVKKKKKNRLYTTIYYGNLKSHMLRLYQAVVIRLNVAEIYTVNHTALAI
jgi:hypothetical protein